MHTKSIIIFVICVLSKCVESFPMDLPPLNIYYEQLHQLHNLSALEESIILLPENVDEPHPQKPPDPEELLSSFSFNLPIFRQVEAHKRREATPPPIIEEQQEWEPDETWQVPAPTRQFFTFVDQPINYHTSLSYNLPIFQNQKFPTPWPENRNRFMDMQLPTRLHFQPQPQMDLPREEIYFVPPPPLSMFFQKWEPSSIARNLETEAQNPSTTEIPENAKGTEPTTSSTSSPVAPPTEGPLSQSNSTTPISTVDAANSSISEASYASAFANYLHTGNSSSPLPANDTDAKENFKSHPSILSANPAYSTSYSPATDAPLGGVVQVKRKEVVWTSPECVTYTLSYVPDGRGGQKPSLTESSTPTEGCFKYGKDFDNFLAGENFSPEDNQ